MPGTTFAVGSATLTVVYSGDASHLGSQDGLTVTTVKAGSSTEAKVKPQQPTTNQKVKLTVKVETTTGVEATGKVEITADGDTDTKTLNNGTLKLNLGKFGKGKHKVKVVYLGTSNIEGSKAKETFTVVKK